jgi:hypothetical protein
VPARAPAAVCGVVAQGGGRVTVRVGLREAVFGAAVLGLAALIVIPRVGLATALFQATDEPPRPLNQADEALVVQRRGAAQAGGTFDAYGAPGAVVARGTGAQPSGPEGLVTYVLEEVAVPAGASIAPLGGRSDLRTVYRLSVLGGPFRVGALAPVIWLDDTPFKAEEISPDLTRITALVTDRGTLRSGARISVSYGESPEVRQQLPEALSLGGSFR